MLKPLRLIAVGRLKTPFWKDAASHYAERLSRFRNFAETLIRDGDPALPADRRNELEGQGILAALGPRDIPICLDEHGKAFTSRDFSLFLEKISEQGCPCFIVGGAFGLDKAVLAAARHTLALGPMTLPHELARVVLLEQLYRAEAVSRKLPYHHD